MIDKKQPLTKQFLLSFKTGHGDFYQKFVSILKNKVHYCRQVKQHFSCPTYMMAQKCIFMSILQKKHKRFINQELQIGQLADKLKKCRPKILNSINNQKNCIFKKMKDFKIQEMENTMMEIVTRENFAFNSFQLAENTYIYELFKAIFNRSEELSMFGQPKYQPMSYSAVQMSQLSALFDQKVVFFDYNNSKVAPAQINFLHTTTYILRVKDKCAILYVKEPKQFQILTEGTLTIQEVQEIFSKQAGKIISKQQVGFFDKLLGSKTSDLQKIKQGSKLFPDEIQCSKCSKKRSQFDCLKWNYEYFCESCLQNPKLDTSTIPSTLIQKYFNQRGIKHGDYEIPCAQCSSPTYLRKYNPAKKPLKYKCQVCEHTICLEHDTNIYQCYCECRQCKIPTVTVINLNLAACDKCRKKFCRTCKQLSDAFCGCVCKLCHELNQEGHTCKQRCHFCYNHIYNMKVCVCGNKICYGCYYYKLKNNTSKTGAMTCNGPQDYK